MRYLFVFLTVLLVFFPLFSDAQHGHWTDKYKSFDGGLCCGLLDCHVVPVRLVRQDGTQTTVEVGNERMQLPSDSVHISEDMSTWICIRSIQGGITAQNTRCVFLAIGS